MESIKQQIKEITNDIDAFNKAYNADQIWKWSENKMEQIKACKLEFIDHIAFDKRCDVINDVTDLKPLIKDANLIFIKLNRFKDDVIHYAHKLMTENLGTPMIESTTEMIERAVQPLESITSLAYRRSSDTYVSDTQFYSEYKIPVIAIRYETDDPKLSYKKYIIYHRECDMNNIYICTDMLSKMVERILDNFHAIAAYGNLVNDIGRILKHGSTVDDHNIY